MITQIKKVVLEMPDDTFNEISYLSKTLDTSIGDVIGQALALFRIAQGRKVIFKTEKSDMELQTEKYKSQPVRP